jgi:hypothetical protein
MKKTTLFILACFLTVISFAQDTVRVTVCTNFWKTNEPVTATTISANVAYTSLIADRSTQG